MAGAFLFVLALWFALAVVVSFHARGNDRSGGLWFVVTFIFGIFGVIFYLLALTRKSTTT